jgi:Epoxide hydrolase N terminus
MSSNVENATEIRPFRVDMPEEAVADLRRRIAATRWPSKELVADRSQGVQLATLQELAATGRPSTTGARARRN